MTNQDHDHDPERLERSLRVWLTEGRPPLADRDAQINTVLDSLDDTPRTRARFLGRWFDRGRGARRGANAHDHPPDTNRRSRLMLTATGITAALAILALTVNVVDTDPAPPNAVGATHVVTADGSGDYTTIQAAIDAAEPGDTVAVQPGTYTEAVVIDKDITLSGDGPVEDIIITAPDDGPTAQIAPRWGSATDPYAVLLLETNAVLSGLTFQGERSEIHATGGSPTISDLVLEGVGLPYRGGSSPAGSGILVSVSSSATISGNVMNGGGPIAIFDPSKLIVEGNTLVDGPHIWGYLGDETVIRGNTISGALVRGINLSDDSSPLIEGNTITDAGQSGIRLRAADSPVVSDNTITGSGTAGISVNTGTPILSGNSLSDNQTGIGWSGASGLIEGNTVTGGRTGIMVGSGSPSLEGNAITGAEGFGIAVGARTSPSMTGNTSCGNAQNLRVDDTASPVIADDNEICEDAATE